MLVVDIVDVFPNPALMLVFIGDIFPNPALAIVIKNLLKSTQKSTLNAEWSI